MRCQEEIDRMFERLVERLGELLPDFGRTLAVDSKAIESPGRPAKTELADGRRDVDAEVPSLGLGSQKSVMSLIL